MSTPRAVPSTCASILLSVRGLTVTYAGEGGQHVPALRQVDLDIAPGEIVGILGESGSGKSTLALSLLGLLPQSAQVEGAILVEGEDLSKAAESRWTAIRGVKLAMIFQEPGLALSPVMRAGDQIGEVIRAHRSGTRKWRKHEVEAALTDAGLSDVDRVYRAYPHQLSGGELHRVAIAQALACRPALMIADELTRSLDVVLQADIQNALRDTGRKHGSALIFITHNPALLTNFADRVVVMYAGRIVEAGPIEQVYRRPLHPYTRALLQLVPETRGDAGPVSGFTIRERLPVIPGNLSALDYLSQGCAFEPRCAASTATCRVQSPEDVTPEPGRRVSCFNYGN